MPTLVKNIPSVAVIIEIDKNMAVFIVEIPLY
jgi:hypothetical protein